MNLGLTIKGWWARRQVRARYVQAAKRLAGQHPSASQKGQRYAASRPGRLVGERPHGWMRDFNSLVEGANPFLREKVRGLVRDFPPFQRAIAAQAAFVVGRGARFQSQVTDDRGQSLPDLRRKIENRFNAWMERASVDGDMHFYECQRLAVRQRLECGEFFFCFRQPKGKGRHPLALQFIEPDRIQGGLDLSPTDSANLVWQGIEFDPETGERAAYHVLKEQYPGRYEWGYDVVAAEDMVHGFKTLRPGQLRGVTEFAPAIILADDLADYMGAEIDGAKMAAKWLAFVTSPDPGGFQSVRPPLGAAGQGGNKNIEDLENAILEYLKPGEDIKLANASGRAGDSFIRGAGFILRMISICIGLPYEILSNDYQGINYSTSRVCRNDFNMLLEPWRFWLINRVSRPVFRRWLKWEALTQNYLPDYYWQNPAHFEKAMWVPAGMPSPDPLREGKATIDSIKAVLTSPQEAILHSGGDPEVVVENWVKWLELCREKGLPFDLAGISTAMQQNPDKLDKLGDDDISYFEDGESDAE